MKKGFPKSCLSSFLTAVLALVIFHFVFLSAPSEAKETKVKTAQESTSTSHDFQEVKKDLGYQDPNRFKNSDPVFLIKGLIAVLGVWLILAMILYVLFYQTKSTFTPTPKELTRGGHIKPRRIRRSFDD